MTAVSPARVWTFSVRGAADIRAAGEISETPDGVGFTLGTAEGRRAVQLRFAGRHNVGAVLSLDRQRQFLPNWFGGDSGAGDFRVGCFGIVRFAGHEASAIDKGLQMHLGTACRPNDSV